MLMPDTAVNKHDETPARYHDVRFPRQIAPLQAVACAERGQ